MEENLKDKLRKLAKAEMKKRNLIPKSSIITGNEIIKNVRSSNNLPPLPKQSPTFLQGFIYRIDK